MSVFRARIASQVGRIHFASFVMLASVLALTVTHAQATDLLFPPQGIISQLVDSGVGNSLL